MIMRATTANDTASLKRRSATACGSWRGVVKNNLYQARCIGMHDRHACRQAFFDVLNVDNFGFTGLVVIAPSLVSQNAQNASALPGREAAEGNEAYDDLIYGYSTRIPKVIGGSE